MQSEVLVEAICSHVQAELETLGIRSTVGEAERGIVRAGLDVETLTQEDRELLARKGPTGMFVRRVESAVQAALRSAAANEVPADYTCGEVLLAVDGDLEGTLAATLGGGFEQSLYGSSPELSLLTLEPEENASPGRSLIFTNGAGQRELETLATTGSAGGLLPADARPGGTMSATGPMPSLGGESDASRGGDTLEQGDDLTVSQLSGVGQVASGNDLAEQLLALMESYASAGRSAGVSVLPSSREMVGKVLDDKYEIRSLLGEGGFGAVFLAYDRLTETEVAIKTIKELDPERLEMFKTEARRVARLSHQNIIQWRSLNEMSDGSVYFVMELLKGKELADIMELEPRMPAGRAQELLLQVLRGLEHAHTRDLDDPILHLDLKPQNIFVTPAEHGGDHAKVIDFGIGGMTPEYASPEQCHMYTKPGAPPLDSRSDLYSLGITAFKLLTGEYPFEKPERRLDWLQVHQEVAPAKIASKDAKVPRKLAAFVERCLEKDRDKRWPDTTTAREALEEIVSPPRRTLALVAQIVAAVLVVLGPMVYVLTRPGLPEIALTHDGVAIAGREQPFYFGPENLTRKLNLTADFAAGNDALELVHDLEGTKSRYWRVLESEMGSKELTIEAKAQQGTSKVQTLYLRGVTEGKQQFSEPFSVQWIGEDAWQLTEQQIALPGWREDLAQPDSHLTYQPPDDDLQILVNVRPGLDVGDIGLRLAYGLTGVCSGGTQPVVRRGDGSCVAKLALRDLLPDDEYDSPTLYIELYDGQGNRKRKDWRLPRVDRRQLGSKRTVVSLKNDDGNAFASAEIPLTVKVSTKRGAYWYWGATRNPNEKPEERELGWCDAGEQKHELRLPANGDAEYDVYLIARAPSLPKPLHERGAPIHVKYYKSEPQFSVIGFEQDVSSKQMEAEQRGGGALLKIITDRVDYKVRNDSDSWITVRWQLDRGKPQTLELVAGGSDSLSGLDSALEKGKIHHLSLWAFNGKDFPEGSLQSRDDFRRELDLVFDPEPEVVNLSWEVDPPKYVSDNVQLEALEVRMNVVRKGGHLAEMSSIKVLLEKGGKLVWQKLLDPRAEQFSLVDTFDQFSLEGLCSSDGAYSIKVDATDVVGRSCRLEEPLKFNVAAQEPSFISNPQYRKVNERWVPEDDKWSLDVQVKDPNGVASVRGVITERRGVITENGGLRSEFSFKQPEGDSQYWSADVKLDYEHKWSKKEAKLEVTALDSAGNTATEIWPIVFSEIKSSRPRQVQVYAKGEKGFQDPVLMQLVKSNAEPYTCFGRGADDEEDIYSEYDDLTYKPNARDESVVLRVGEIKDFYMDVNEVTVDQYLKFVEDEDYDGDGEDWLGRKKGWEDAQAVGNGDLPVTMVTLVEAEAFAAAVGKRLPTLVQWEYAVRGCEFLPTTRPRKIADLRFNAGKYAEIDSGRRAWKVSDASDDKSSLGILNLCSNVREWTSTAHLEVKLDAVSWANGIGGAVGEGKFFTAGGHFKSDRFDFFEKRRFGKDVARSEVGFRCVLPAESLDDESRRWRFQAHD